MDCPICRGTGWVWRSMHVGDPYQKFCIHCKGTGVASRLDEKIAASAKHLGLNSEYKLGAVAGVKRKPGPRGKRP